MRRRCVAIVDRLWRTVLSKVSQDARHGINDVMRRLPPLFKLADKSIAGFKLANKRFLESLFTH